MTEETARRVAVTLDTSREWTVVSVPRKPVRDLLEDEYDWTAAWNTWLAERGA
jgi:hypothetical protein